MEKKILGVLCGMGPAAGARFFSRITELTYARSDSEHMEVMLHSVPYIADRSAFILKKSTDDPFEQIKKELILLELAGAGIIAVPCNTAEYFYSKMQNILSVPVLSVTRVSAAHALGKGFKRVGILATQGTIYAGLYQKACSSCGLDCVLPSSDEQLLLNEIIYGRIKSSLPVPRKLIERLLCGFIERGCDSFILGCTELSFISPVLAEEKYKFVDSLDALAADSIKACGYKLNESKIHK